MGHDSGSIHPAAVADRPAQVKANDGAGMSEASSVVDFWRAAGPSAWFSKDPAFDLDFRRRFFDLHFAAARREREHWMGDPNACLALILLLDQFPRNAFRGTAHMYATDSLARRYARAAIHVRHLDHIEDALKLFAVVPFIHSEDIDDQRYGVQLYRRYAPNNVRFALDHCDIVQRFGRFPHRNPELGRITTPDEEQFLEKGGFSG